LYVYLKYTDVEALKEIVNVSVIFEPSWTVFIPEDKLFKTSHNFYIFHSYFKYLYYLLTFNASKYRLNHKFLILSTTSTLIVGNLFHFPFFFLLKLWQLYRKSKTFIKWKRPRRSSDWILKRLENDSISWIVALCLITF